MPLPNRTRIQGSNSGTASLQMSAGMPDALSGVVGVDSNVQISNASTRCLQNVHKRAQNNFKPVHSNGSSSVVHPRKGVAEARMDACFLPIYPRYWVESFFEGDGDRETFPAIGSSFTFRFGDFPALPAFFSADAVACLLLVDCEIR
jgi:hypothetical protein